jgi:hypothetical protein
MLVAEVAARVSIIVVATKCLATESNHNISLNIYKMI